jgi:hypothetical protein
MIGNPAAVGFNDTGAINNATTVGYSYKISACNAFGCSADTKIAVVPFKPITLKATPGSGNIGLTWVDKSLNEKGFEVFRKPGACAAAGTFAKIHTTAANIQAYSNTGLVGGTTYSYKVRAFTKSPATPYAYGYSSYSNCVNATAQ